MGLIAGEFIPRGRACTVSSSWSYSATACVMIADSGGQVVIGDAACDLPVGASLVVTNGLVRPSTGLDTIGWFIATTHQLLGHNKAAALLGCWPGDKAACVICRYEADPTPERKQAVVDALSGEQ